VGKTGVAVLIWSRRELCSVWLNIKGRGKTRAEMITGRRGVVVVIEPGAYSLIDDGSVGMVGRFG